MKRKSQLSFLFFSLSLVTVSFFLLDRPDLFWKIWFFFPLMSADGMLWHFWLQDFFLLLLASCGVLLSFSARRYNLGLVGQLYLGAFIAAWSYPFVSLIPALFLGALAGASLAGLSAIAYIQLKASELLTTWLLSRIVSLLIDQWILSASSQDLTDSLLAGPFVLVPYAWPYLAILVFVVVGLFLFALYLSPWGRAWQFWREDPSIASYFGIEPWKQSFWPLFSSGFVLGLTGAALVFFLHGRLLLGMAESLGMLALSVSMLAWHHWLALIPATFVISYFKMASQASRYYVPGVWDFSGLLDAVILLVLALYLVPNLKKGGVS